MADGDTTAAAEAALVGLLREAGTARRAALVFDPSSSAIRASRAAIAKRFPELDPQGVDLQGVDLRWAELHHGRALADRVRRHLGRPS